MGSCRRSGAGRRAAGSNGVPARPPVMSAGLRGRLRNAPGAMHTFASPAGPRVRRTCTAGPLHSGGGAHLAPLPASRGLRSGPARGGEDRMPIDQVRRGRRTGASGEDAGPRAAVPATSTARTATRTTRTTTRSATATRSAATTAARSSAPSVNDSGGSGSRRSEVGRPGARHRAPKIAVPTPHAGRALLDRDAPVGAHPHRQLGDPERSRSARSSAEVRPRVLAGGGMHMSPTSSTAGSAADRRGERRRSSPGAQPAFDASPPVFTSRKHARDRALRGEAAARARGRARSRSTVCTQATRPARYFTLFVCSPPMKCQRRSGEVGERVGLLAPLLRVVLAEVALPRRVRLADRRGGLRLRDRDEGHARGELRRAARRGARRSLTAITPRRRVPGQGEPGAAEQLGRLGEREPDDVRDAPLDPEHERAARALDRVGAGLVERLARARRTRRSRPRRAARSAPRSRRPRRARPRRRRRRAGRTRR